MSHFLPLFNAAIVASQAKKFGSPTSSVFIPRQILCLKFLFFVTMHAFCKPAILKHFDKE